jgi:hypothetical protein
LIAIPIIEPIIPELTLLALLREAVNTLPTEVETICIAIPIIVNIIVIVHAHPFPLKSPYDMIRYPIPIISNTPPIAAKLCLRIELQQLKLLK